MLDDWGPQLSISRISTKTKTNSEHIWWRCSFVELCVGSVASTHAASKVYFWNTQTLIKCVIGFYFDSQRSQICIVFVLFTNDDA